MFVADCNMMCVDSDTGYRSVTARHPLCTNLVGPSQLRPGGGKNYRRRGTMFHHVLARRIVCQGLIFFTVFSFHVQLFIAISVAISAKCSPYVQCVRSVFPSMQHDVGPADARRKCSQAKLTMFYST